MAHLPECLEEHQEKSSQLLLSLQHLQPEWSGLTQRVEHLQMEILVALVLHQQSGKQYWESSKSSRSRRGRLWSRVRRWSQLVETV